MLFRVQSNEPPRYAKTIAATVAMVAVVSVAACSAGSRSQASGSTTTVRSLWYGEQPDGSILHGVTPVNIESNKDNGRGEFVVDLDGLSSAGTGKVWDAAALSAAAVATLGSTTDPTNLTISYEVNESIDGPSAGGLMTLGTLANLNGKEVAPTDAMTGTILPGGGLGPVGGIPEKIRAASEQGITRVLIPLGQSASVDPTTGLTVDVVEQGQRLGVEVREVTSVAEAYRTFVGPPPAEAVGEVGALDSALVDLLAAETRAALARTDRIKIAPSPGPNYEAERSQLVASFADTRRYTRTELSRGNVSAAMGAITFAERAVISWNSAAKTLDVARARGTEAAATVLADQIGGAQKSILESTESFAATPVTKLEQFGAIPDALSWSTDALAQLEVAASALQQATRVDENLLADVSSSLADATYDGQKYLPIAMRAASITGAKDPGDTAVAVDVLNGYSTLLASAARANSNYYQVSVDAAFVDTASEHDVAFAKAIEDRFTQIPDRDDLPTAMLRMSAAMSGFVATSLLINSLGTIGAAGDGSGAARNIAITNRRTFLSQSELANEQVAQQSAQMAALGLDTSYSRWGNEWGQAMAAAAALAKVTDQSRREGLSYQWYANIQQDFVTALAKVS